MIRIVRVIRNEVPYKFLRQVCALGVGGVNPFGHDIPSIQNNSV